MHEVKRLIRQDNWGLGRSPKIINKMDYPHYSGACSVPALKSWLFAPVVNAYIHTQGVALSVTIKLQECNEL